MQYIYINTYIYVCVRFQRTASERMDHGVGLQFAHAWSLKQLCNTICTGGKGQKQCQWHQRARPRAQVSLDTNVV